MCCGTKRRVEIQCPPDCPYLASARDHPAAAVVRQQQRDVTLIAQFVRDFNDRQSRLFLVLTTFLLRYEPPDLQSIVDDDVAEAAAAVAGTFETASRGVIYEHRPASLPADRLATAIKTLLAEAGKSAPPAFDRDAAVVLRRIEQMVREVGSTDSTSRRGWLDLIGRVLRPSDAGSDPSTRSETESPRLIMP